MQHAAARYAPDWDTASLPAEVHKTRRVRKTVKVNNKRKLYIKCAVIVFGYALILVFLCMKSAALGYQIASIEQEVHSIETANLRLEYQIAEKSSLAHVEQVAIAQLGMHKPEPELSIAMNVQNDPLQVAAGITVAADNQTTLSQKILKGMYSGLERLALNNK